MTLVGLGVALAAVGLILWLAAIAPGIGYALIVVGLIVLVVGLLLDHRGRRAL